MHKLKLKDYIYLLDRMLEREGLAENERDEIFNQPSNIELISAYFDHRKHPSILIKKLDRSPVQSMYADSIDESEDQEELTAGQQYAINFLRSMGLILISSPLQCRRGNLIFKENNGEMWGIYKNGGYIRRWGSNRWGVLYTTERGRMIEDDEYIELAHMLSEKIRTRRKKPKFRSSYVDRIYKLFLDQAEGLKGSYYSSNSVTDLEVIEAVKKLYKKYVE